jgi:hypothetical protein
MILRGIERGSEWGFVGWRKWGGRVGDERWVVRFRAIWIGWMGRLGIHRLKMLWVLEGDLEEGVM